MKRAYFAVSFSNRKLFEADIAYLKTHLRSRQIKLLVFVDKYHYKSDEEQDMMEMAFKEIDTSDFLIAELTTKSIGVGIEIGYAYAKKKPIIYLRQKNAEYSTTASGSSDYNIEYKDKFDLVKQIDEVLDGMS
jgi:nucleoside 2-deoxyribosyltransferase